MIITQLKLCNFRNLTELELRPHPRINVIFGKNGAGKTSLLEAIYYLGRGKSFRTFSGEKIIQKDKDRLFLFAQTEKTTIGMERHRDGLLKFKIADDDIRFISQLARHLPLQLINPDAYYLLNEGPKFRREFIDWGLFHVEPSFLANWKEYHKIIKQRNLAIKMRTSKEEIESWNQGLINTCDVITKLREQYIKEFLPYFFAVLEKILKINNLTIQYDRGWSSQCDYFTQLKNTYQEDRQYGFTRYGAHRADLLISIAGSDAKDVLSRGQQKLFVYAMRLAQGLLLKYKTGINCIYLIDDLPAELDKERCNALFAVLRDLDTQIFVSSIDLAAVASLKQDMAKEVFHVEQGSICRFSS